MSKLIAFFVRQGLFADMLTIFVIAFGIYSTLQIQREVFPNVSYDIISIGTIFPGASSDEIEKLITTPIERELKEVDGIKKMTSVSVENRSTIVIQVDVDQVKNATVVRDDIQEVVDKIQDLPEGAERPVVRELESKIVPVIEVALSGYDSEDDLRAVAKLVEARIEKLRGIGRAEINGKRDYEIRVEVSLEKLARLQVSLDEATQALKRQNISIPGGTIEVQGEGGLSREYIIRTTGDFESVADVQNTVVRANALGQPILIKDVARVTQDFVEPKIIYRANAKPSMTVTVFKKEKADAVSVVDLVKVEMEKIQREQNGALKVSYINDFSYFIRRRLSVLSGNLIVGLILVISVLAFLMEKRMAFLAASGIPFSFLGAMIYFYVSGYSINLISMMGLIIVSGMLVDDAIVVTDNIQRYINKGLSPIEAAIKGTVEVWRPVAASVMTTILAFIPMLFMQGIMGKFMIAIPIGVMAALVASLIEAFFVLPYHSTRLGKPVKPIGETKGIFNRIISHVQHFWDDVLQASYLKMLKGFVEKRYFVAGGAVLFFVGTLWFAVKKMDFVLFPKDGIEILVLNIEGRRGLPLSETSQAVYPIEKVVSELSQEELEAFTTKVGIWQQQADDPNVKRGSQYAQVMIYLTPESDRQRTADEIVEELKKKVGLPSNIVGVEYTRLAGGPPVGKAVSIGVRGVEFAPILEAVGSVKAELEKISGVTDVRSSYEEGKDEFRVLVNASESAAAGLTVTQVGLSIRAAYEGVVATSIRKLDEEIEVRVSLDQKAKKDFSSLNNLLIPNPTGNLVPLSRIAKIQSARGVSAIEHENSERQVRVTAEVNPEITTSQKANDSFREKLADLQQRHPQVSFNFGGEDFDTAESVQNLIKTFLFAVLGIFMILVLTFQNLFQPLLVVLTIPLGIVSVVWTFFFHGKPLTFLAVLGVIALAGVVVNNAIVLVDFINQNRKNGMDLFESIYEAARVRLKPIFLTTVTTVCGLLPTAYGIGGLDPFVVPIALSLGWGLAFASILTTFVIPPAIAIVDDVRSLFSRWF